MLLPRQKHLGMGIIAYARLVQRLHMPTQRLRMISPNPFHQTFLLTVVNPSNAKRQETSPAFTGEP